MATENSPNSPVADALTVAIQPKLVELGWGTGGPDDAPLVEYIILMLENGKTQEQIAQELATDLLNLGPDDSGTRDFAQWLFQLVERLNQQGNGAPADNASRQQDAQDTAMGDASEQGDVNMYVHTSPASSASLKCHFNFIVLTFRSPTGPKSMRNGSGPSNSSRDKRMFGQLQSAMGRTDPLHRVRAHGGNERIGAQRGVPNGPRGAMGRGNRTGAMGVHGAHGPSSGAANMMNMNPQQQMAMMQLFEQQQQIMSQIFSPEHAAMMNNNGLPFNIHQPQSRSLFDRVQGRGGAQNGIRKGSYPNAQRPKGPPAQDQPPRSPLDSALTPAGEAPNPNTTCKYNLKCTNKDCKFAHQSPAAPPGTAIDVTDVCAFGAACKNRKCTGRHPSPYQKKEYQQQTDCKFGAHCKNPSCVFKHPSPLCRNGADCKVEGCKFTHVTTPCRFNPCTNPNCAFKHEEGQKREFRDKVWVAGQEGKHVSERKFVAEGDGDEELVKPAAEGQAGEEIAA
jgi:hypothetical protein